MHPYYLQQLFQQLHKVSDRLDQLEKTISKLSQNIEDLKQKDTAPPNQIQYHFDQIKIEKLEGTLNIGTTPGEGKSIDNIAVDNKPVPPQANPEIDRLTANVRKQILLYLSEEVPCLFDYLLKTNNLPLSDSYKTQVLDDIGKQIDDRIVIYVKQVNDLPELTDEQQKVDLVTSQLKRDIQTALHQHIEQNLLGK